MGRLKELRLEKGMTQQNVANVLGMSQQVYTRYETGKTEMSYKSLITLADLYDVTLDYLLERVNVRTNFSSGLVSDGELNEFIETYSKLNDKERQKAQGYIEALTGSEEIEKRTGRSPSPAVILTVQERQVIDCYRTLSPANKNVVMSVLNSFRINELAKKEG